MELPDFLVEVPFGEIRLTGSRIGLFHIVHDYNEGLNAEGIHEEFPSLSLELIHKVIAFYQENRAEVDAYMARCYADMEERYAKAPKIDWAELQRRMEARNRTESK
jgi:uncharacterized protein (DUF433 family)